jgi:hypothetical protein
MIEIYQYEGHKDHEGVCSINSILLLNQYIPLILLKVQDRDGNLHNFIFRVSIVLFVFSVLRCIQGKFNSFKYGMK